ncbi:family 16 glycosylhydrolase [Marinilabilia salmonicolor]|uniref:Glycosyl hydrolase family 16 n=1 Tax=Marinilabilia salmonicolor TaxID=989 RepID=A0A368UYM4_9BACT|nr:glycoside hydrolase family 16 protein [Marinilabilia salmonicolor]RCW33926.1 glycosyl hydrolase family 16 [Marinilabilia salmonicolor]
MIVSWKKTVLLILLPAIVVLPGCIGGNPGGMELVWSEEFDYEGLPDETKWNYDTVGNSYGWGNNELQYYTVRDKKNAWVDGEYLNITAVREKRDDFNYTSARLTTKEKGDWLYGRMEIRAQVPGGRGIWPAIWMLPTDWEYGGWPESGEIDIMEHVGYDSDSIHTTVHTEAFNHGIGTQKGKATYVPDCEEAFYVYAIEWDEEKIDFFIDDKLVFTFNNTKSGPAEWPFDKRFHLILNVAVGGNWGGVHGVDDSIFPSTMKVDYVRIYQ